MKIITSALPEDILNIKYEKLKIKNFDVDDFWHFSKGQTNSQFKIIDNNKLLNFIFPENIDILKLEEFGSGKNNNKEFNKYLTAKSALYDIWIEIMTNTGITHNLPPDYRRSSGVILSEKDKDNFISEIIDLTDKYETPMSMDTDASIIDFLNSKSEEIAKKIQDLFIEKMEIIPFIKACVTYTKIDHSENPEVYLDPEEGFELEEEIYTINGFIDLVGEYGTVEQSNETSFGSCDARTNMYDGSHTTYAVHIKNMSDIPIEIYNYLIQELKERKILS